MMTAYLKILLKMRERKDLQPKPLKKSPAQEPLESANVPITPQYEACTKSILFFHLKMCQFAAASMCC
ncbi:hypothetical protein Hanom_Chr04g00303351 [Helianthus anomalus]